MEKDLAYYEIEDQIATVTINHPPMNALDVPTKEALEKVFDELDERRHEIRVVILRGGGEKAFAAGADIKVFLDDYPERARRRLMKSHSIYKKIEDFHWPVIAAIHGFCLGGGLELSLCCDIRYATEDASFGFPEVNLSIFPGNGGIPRTFYFMSLGKIKEMVYTGKMIKAPEAESLGIVDKVVAADQIMEEAGKLAKKIASKGPLGIAAAKKVINRVRDMTLTQGLELETDYWSGLASTEDMKEGAKAFLEKRKPAYKGK